MATSERQMGAVGQGRLDRVGKERRWVKYEWWKCTLKRRPRYDSSGRSKHSKLVQLMPVRLCGKSRMYAEEGKRPFGFGTA